MYNNNVEQFNKKYFFSSNLKYYFLSVKNFK